MASTQMSFDFPDARPPWALTLLLKNRTSALPAGSFQEILYQFIVHMEGAHAIAGRADTWPAAKVEDRGARPEAA
jgi:hypothetical protein